MRLLYKIRGHACFDMPSLNMSNDLDPAQD